MINLGITNMKLLPDFTGADALPTVKYIDLAEFTLAELSGKTVIINGITYTIGGTSDNRIVLESSHCGTAANLAEGVNTNKATYGAYHQCTTPQLLCIAESFGTKCYFATRVSEATLAITGDFTVSTAS